MKQAARAKGADAAKSRETFFKKGGGQGFFRHARSGDSFFARSSPDQGVVQPKLRVGQPNDVYEREADHVADKVAAQVSGGGMLQKKCAHCEKEEKLQEKEDDQKPVKDEIRKKPIFESNAEPPEDPVVQRKSKTGGQLVPTHIENNLKASKGAGSPLPETTRGQMESSFGADLGNVRIHDNGAAAAMNKDLHAQAFTHGSDIYFNTGKYDTGSKDGKHLLAHELTHVRQQTGGDQSVQRLPSWDDIKEGVSEAAEEVGEGLSEVGSAVKSAAGEVGEGLAKVESAVGSVAGEVGEALDWLASEAGKLALALANDLLSQFGGSIKLLPDGGIQITLPNVTVVDRYSQTFPWDASTPDQLLAQLPIELGPLGLIFLTLYARGELHAALTAGIGPVQLKDMVLTIDPKADYYSGAGSLSAAAEIGGTLELTGIIGGLADWNCAIEVVRLEGGLSGLGRAGVSMELKDSVLVTYSGGEFNFENKLNLENCLRFSFDLNALANLFLLQSPVWSGNWTLANWPWERCWPFALAIRGGSQEPYQGGGGSSGGGGASGSYGDDNVLDGGAAPGGAPPATGVLPTGNVETGNAAGGAAPSAGGQPNQPGWDASELIKTLFSASSPNPQLNLSAVDAKTKETIQAACPIKKDESSKPYTWNDSVYDGRKGVLTYSKKRPDIPDSGYIPHGHHVWPKNIAGPEKQTLLNVAGGIHQREIHGTGGVHDFLSNALSAEMEGKRISRHKSDAGNQKLIGKMRDDLPLRIKVANLLQNYYKKYRDQSDPQMPVSAYLRGIEESVNNLDS
jgi:hypothetical protein